MGRRIEASLKPPLMRGTSTSVFNTDWLGATKSCGRRSDTEPSPPAVGMNTWRSTESVWSSVHSTFSTPWQPPGSTQASSVVHARPSSQLVPTGLTVRVHPPKGLQIAWLHGLSATQASQLTVSPTSQAVVSARLVKVNVAGPSTEMVSTAMSGTVVVSTVASRPSTRSVV